MKWLFILLLLVNVIYLGWELDRETKIRVSNYTTAYSIPDSAKKLQLISEMQNLPEIRNTRAPDGDDMSNIPEPEMDLTTTEDLVADLPEIVLNDADDINSNVACFRYGPIPDENMVKGLYDWFRSRDVLARIQFIEDQSSQMFWIYLAPQQSRETALAVIAEMQSKGIGDFRLINRGDLENAISLGLFSSRDAINNRLRELNDKGFVPIVVPYADVNRIFWLNIKMTTAAAVADEIYSGFPAKYESIPVNCDDISGL
jgi:hypothetical protein